MATVFAVNGSTVGRAGNHLILDSLTLSVDEPEQLQWTELRLPAGTGSWSAGDFITATIDGVVRFRGQTVSAQPTAVGRGCINVAYTAMGLRFLCNEIYYTAADLTGYQAWNMPRTDPDYGQASAGKSVGQILKQALDLHQTQLTALGFATPPYDPAELLALDVVPRDAIVFSGRLLDNCADLVTRWAPKYNCYPDASDGLIHFRNTLTLPTITLTLDADPVILEAISKTHGECYTRVVARGSADVQGAYLSLSEGTLEAGWTMAQQTAWTIEEYWNPKGSASSGDITAMSSTTLTVAPDDPLEWWGVTTFWSDLGAVVWAYDPTATGITFQEQRFITANSVKIAGATGTLTVDTPYNNSGYTRYQIRGTFSEGSTVWRKLKIVPVDGAGHNWVADHLVRRFPHSVPWSPADGVLVQVTDPVGVVCWSSSGSPPYMEFPWPFQVILPDGTSPGYILFAEPLVKAYSTQAALVAGGGSVLAPGDVKVLVPYSLGALSAIVPPDVAGVAQFEGTAKTVDGIQRTLYLDYQDWFDRRDRANMMLLAREKLDSVKDTVYEGTITFEGKLSTALTMGKGLNIARAGGTTGWETLKAPITTVELLYQDRSAIWLTRLHFSTRRRAFAGDRLYAPVSWGIAAQLAEGHTLNIFDKKTIDANWEAWEDTRDQSREWAEKQAEASQVGVNRGADPLGVAGIVLPAAQTTGGYTPEGPGSKRQAAAVAADAAGANTFNRRDTYAQAEQQAQQDARSNRAQAEGRDDEIRKLKEAEERRQRKKDISQASGKVSQDIQVGMDAVTQATQVAEDTDLPAEVFGE